MTLVPGTRLGSYEIVSPLGAGGMGEVYRARDPRLSREVAIKVLPDHVASDRGRVARFEREAKVLAALRHPGIAVIHAFEEVEGRGLLVMELAEGEGLDQRTARGPVPIAEAISIARQIAEALEAAHEQGIVHRDLKPANVRVAPDGRVKLLDFGLAKALSPEAAAAESSRATRTMEPEETARGAILGTAPYMSPEQARGWPVDRRADIWAFGVVLWEMLTGRRLFGGASASDAIANVLKQPIAPDAAPRRVRPRLLAAALAAAAVLEALAAWRFRPAPSTPLRAVSFPVEDLLSNFKQGPVVSPDGTRVLYVSDRRLRIQSLTDPLARPFDLAPLDPGPELRYVAFWARDSSRVAFTNGNRLWRVAAGGGTPALVCEVPESGAVQGGDWNADDEIVFSVWNGSLYRVPGSGGGAEVLVRRDPRTESDFHSPQFLPEGRGVLFAVHPIGSNDGTAEILTGGRRVRVLAGRALIARTLYAPGHLVFEHVEREGIWEIPFSLSRLAPGQSPRLVLPEGTCASLASDGTLVFVRGGSDPLRELVWVRPDGTVQARASAPARSPGPPVLSPDEGSIAVSYGNGARVELLAIDVARGGATRLRTLFGQDVAPFPSWLPSGRGILFTRAKGSQATLSWMPAAVDAEPRDLPMVGSNGRRLGQAVLEPDGRHLLYATIDDSRRADLLRVAVDDAIQPSGPPSRLAGSSREGSRFTVAPQGDVVAYVAGLERGDTEVLLSELGGGRRWQVSNGVGDQPCWSRKGDRLFYVAAGQMMEVEVHRGTDLSLGAPRRLFSLAGERLLPGAGFDVASDGRFLMVRDSEPKRIAVVVNGTLLLGQRAP